MNRDNVLSIATSTLGANHPFKGDTYRGQIIIDDKTAGIYFLDFNDKITLDNFSSYQETLLANEYYNLPTDQQWNFYLFLLRDQVDLHFKSLVEQNDRYARKYVFRENEFKDFFTLEKSDKKIKSTLISDWKTDLNAIHLSDVYGNAKIKEVAQAVDSGVLEQLFTGPRETTSMNEPKIHFVNKINLTQDYRRHPTDPRTFSFGKVNLVRGQNGSGKTSLFEAIEIALCGMAVRNPEVKEKNGCVEITYNNNPQPEIFKAKEVEKFRRRDLEWYGSTSVKFNRLHYSFNKFNFFNADAAYTFSNTNNETEIKQALLNIILGPEYDYISDRVEKLLKEIKPIFNKLDLEWKDQEKKEKEAILFISSWKESDSLQFLRSEITKDLAGIKPKKPLPLISDSYVEIDSFVHDTGLYCRNLLKNEMYSKDTVLQFRKALDIQQKKLRDFEFALNRLQEDIKTNQGSTKTMKEQKTLLEQADKYFLHDNGFQVSGLQQRLHLLETRLANIQQVQSQVSGVDLDAYKINISFEETSREHDRLVAETTLLLFQEREALDDALKKLASAQKKVSEIRLLGQSFLQENPQENNCPLCETTFEKGVLLEKIREWDTLMNAIDGPRFAEKNDQINKLSSELETQRADQENFKKIKLAAALLTPKSTSENLVDIVKQIQNAIGERASLQEQYDTERGLKKSLQSLQITEEGFNTLKNQLERLFPGTPFSPENETFFKTTAQKLSGQLTSLEQEQQLQLEKGAELATQVKKDLELPPEESFTLAQLQKMMESREMEYKSIQNTWDKLASLVTLDQVDLNDLDLLVSRLVKNLELYKSELTREIRLQEMKVKQTEASTFLAKNRKRYERYEIVINALTKIKDTTPESQINTFFDQHLVQILDIFKTIHAPREFKNIQLNEKGDLELITIGNENRKITQVSTGQRSALAISIFLTLNASLQNGPDLIMFDDPVAFVDDLNTLAFLDYLRLFVLKEHKQIFFATANNKLASLFEKKFLFLENDFKKWALARPEEPAIN